MGSGLQRAFAAARATQLSKEEASEMKQFLDTLLQYEGTATSRECPLASRAQDRVRRKAKRLGWVTYEGGYWRITDAGRAAFRNI